MELKEYLKILKGNIILILAVVIAGMVIAGFSLGFLPSGYSSKRLYYLTSADKSTGQQVENQDFYTQERNRNFTDTAVAILESPDFQKDLNIGGSIQVRKAAPQVIRLTVINGKSGSSTEDLEKTASFFNQRMLQLSNKEKPLELVPVGSASPETSSGINPLLLVSFGALVGLIFGLLSVGIKVYFRL